MISNTCLLILIFGLFIASDVDFEFVKITDFSKLVSYIQTSASLIAANSAVTIFRAVDDCTTYSIQRFGSICVNLDANLPSLFNLVLDLKIYYPFLVILKFIRFSSYLTKLLDKL